VEEALVSALLNNAALAALVSTRIDWLLRPQGSAVPAITLQVVSGTMAHTFQGRDGLTEYLVQIDVWADTYGSMKTVQRALTAALDGLKAAPLQAFPEQVRETLEPGDAPDTSGLIDLYRGTTDVRVFAA
jgi:hypothetical protein